MPEKNLKALAAYNRLRRETSELPPPYLGLDLCNPAAVLRPDQLAKRQGDLARIALRRQQPVPEDVIVT